MGQALYRKYRSKTLDEMIGQRHITDALKNSISSGRISHAYLFTGPRGVGKTSAARILAHEINHLPYDGTQHLDIIEIDAASNRRIDDIRDLRDRVHIAPTSAAYKVYIIDEVHMLTNESFNALLKTLEEPPEHVVFILATTEVHKLPATIISRTQRYNFRLYDEAEVIAHLRTIADKEHITVDDEALQMIAAHGEGSFRDSINLLDQLANVSGGVIDGASVGRSMGLASQKAIDSLVRSVLQHDFLAINTGLTELENQGANTTSLIPQLIRSLQGQAAEHPQLFELLDQLIDVPRSHNPKLKLRTTLVRFALPSASITPIASPATPTSAAKPVTKPSQAVIAKPALSIEKMPQVPKKPSASQAVDALEKAQGSTLTGISDDQWAQIVASMKDQSAPLHGALRLAQPVFDEPTQTLTLSFKYALHRRKIDDAKGKKILTTLMLDLLGGAPIIRTVIDANTEAPTPVAAPKPTAAEAKPATDQAADKVIAMMGGGEVVHA